MPSWNLPPQCQSLQAAADEPEELSASKWCGATGLAMMSGGSQRKARWLIKVFTAPAQSSGESSIWKAARRVDRRVFGPSVPLSKYGPVYWLTHLQPCCDWSGFESLAPRPRCRVLPEERSFGVMPNQEEKCRASMKCSTDLMRRAICLRQGRSLYGQRIEKIGAQLQTRVSSLELIFNIVNTGVLKANNSSTRPLELGPLAKRVIAQPHWAIDSFTLNE